MQEITDRCPWVHILSTSKYIARSHTLGPSPSSSGGVLESQRRKFAGLGSPTSHALAWREKCDIFREVTKKMTVLKKCWQDRGKPIKLHRVGKLDQMVVVPFVDECYYGKYYPVSFIPGPSLALCLYHILTENCYWPPEQLVMERINILKSDNSVSYKSCNLGQAI